MSTESAYNENMKRIYLDHAASTPLDTHAKEAMMPYLEGEFGNPSALYKEGVSARNAVEDARGRIAKLLFAQSDEIIFTGSGTESDNLAILGVVEAYDKKHDARPHVVTSAIEHPAVYHTIQKLERQGKITATYVPVLANGIIDMAELKTAITKKTALVSVMYANNEIGTIQPIAEVAKVIRKVRTENKSEYPYLHSDACQAVNYLDMQVERLGIDLLTFNGSKLYGPKGIGALYVKRSVEIAQQIVGGGQEFCLRAGTENVANIVGLATAMEEVEKTKKEEAERLRELQVFFIDELLKSIPGSVLNGDREERLPNNVHVSVPSVDNELLVIEMDAHGIACSAQSACKSRSVEQSHVISAIIDAGARGRLGGEGAIRFSMGRSTTKEDLEVAVKALTTAVEKIQKTAQEDN